MNNTVLNQQRIMSIDALRGFDMLMIILADQFFSNLDKAVGSGFTGFLAIQFTHPQWFGFHFYDIIMPLFLFVVGAVIPYSLNRRLEAGTSKTKIILHVIRRVLILFFLGWIVQGHLLELDINRFHIFSNTLQAIAVGYLFSCAGYLYLSKNGRYIFFTVCLIIYALLLTIPNVPGFGKSVLLPDQNFAIYFDRLVFGKFQDGTQYAWLLGGFGFTATTLSGLFAGELIRSDMNRKKVALFLVLLGIAGIILGLVWGIWLPIVKKIWSPSFVLLLSGICYLLLALFYWLIDVKAYTNWAFPFKVIGMNAITAYVLSHVIRFNVIADFILFGTKQYTGNYYPLISTIGGFCILYGLLWYMYKNRTFIKI